MLQQKASENYARSRRGSNAVRTKTIGVRRKQALRRGKLSPEDLEFINEVWAKYDLDGDKNITRAELQGLLQEINEGNSPTEKEVDLLFRAADVDQSGHLNKQELKQVIYTWFLLSENKRKISVQNLTREVKQGIGMFCARLQTGCTSQNQTSNSIIEYPGKEAVSYWNNFQNQSEEKPAIT
uniref:EF-hand domain-containing protein n=1 Tax=Tetraselmis sp. GSL018 TaxID=582737 RepID=A0A061RLG0_9CHLO|mmetsp:Transcript_6136/g.14811  ORF Transcript_6136/g.14811 Transcript_6136/m.14811 type:complete len:182 (-) Transcript_6136:405-950(-)|eukprot:CAMPEP_0177581312 /NCGR_PEP_ID=MMETSP0419_2-20121207/2075_1 /TAXON_ID=582737 /ORGANISM="Tetraselmis sp., Strain GSL018" /LENGTH=181 /DNA_ID=CAMNT_0019070335 /DNA_START=198 /DNA_END=743 /DNA_ORIENTATION=+